MKILVVAVLAASLANSASAQSEALNFGNVVTFVQANGVVLTFASVVAFQAWQDSQSSSDTTK